MLWCALGSTAPKAKRKVADVAAEVGCQRQSSKTTSPLVAYRRRLADTVIPQSREAMAALLEALNSTRTFSSFAGTTAAGRAVTVYYRGDEGKPAWITGMHVKSDFTGTKEEVDAFLQELSGILCSLHQRVANQQQLAAGAMDSA